MMMMLLLIIFTIVVVVIIIIIIMYYVSETKSSSTRHSQIREAFHIFRTPQYSSQVSLTTLAFCLTVSSPWLIMSLHSAGPAFTSCAS